MYDDLANKIIRKAGSITLKAVKIRNNNILGDNGKLLPYKLIKGKFKEIEDVCDDIKLEIFEYFKTER